MDKRGLTRVTGYSLQSLLSFHVVADLRSGAASFVREDNCFSLHCVRPKLFLFLSRKTPHCTRGSSEMVPLKICKNPCV